MRDEQRAEYGDVHSHITIQTSGHHVNGRGRWDFLITLVLVTAFLIVCLLASGLVYALINMAADVLFMLLHG